MLGQLAFASTALGLFTFVAIGVMVYMNYQQQQQEQQPYRAGGFRAPRRRIVSDDWKEVLRHEKESALCSICQDEIIEMRRYTLSCNHSFHEECIMAWAQKKPECPNCRKAL